MVRIFTYKFNVKPGFDLDEYEIDSVINCELETNHITKEKLIDIKITAVKNYYMMTVIYCEEGE